MEPNFLLSSTVAPERATTRSFAGAIPTGLSARAAHETRVRRVEGTDQDSTAGGRRVSPVRAPQPTLPRTALPRRSRDHTSKAPQKGNASLVAASKSLAQSPAQQVKPSLTPALASEPQPHLDLPLAVNRSRRHPSGGSASSEKERGASIQPSQTSRPQIGINVHLQLSGASASQPKSTGAAAAAEQDDRSANPVVGLYQEWAGAADQGLSTSQDNVNRLNAAAGSDDSDDDSLWRMFEEWDSADEEVINAVAGAGLAASAPAMVGGVVETGAAASNSDQEQERGRPSKKKRTALQAIPRTKLSDEEIATIIQYRDERMTWREISKKTGLSIETLRKHRIVGHFGHSVNRSVRSFVPTEKQISDVKKYRAEARDEGFFGSEHSVQRSLRREDLTEDQITEVKRLLGEKNSWKEIQKKTGITKQVLNRRRNEGLFGSEHRVRPYNAPLSEEQISAAKAGLADGKRAREIAKSINMGRDAFMQSKWDGVFGDEYADAERAERARRRLNESSASEALDGAEPLWYLTIAAYGCLIALIRIASDRPGDLFTIGKVKDAVFAEFWLRMGPMFAEGDKATAIPTLVSEAAGVVLELGPGIGSQLPRYNTSKITKVYGVEPNRDLYKSLREKVKASGLTGVYETVPCGIEDVVELKKHGIALGSIDTVLSIQV
ncbi:hypothetical protein GJ744_002627 [Endocarpon pusillum]|uniref:Uncharacterized protein n=1 Tax=Endocarpon pusillum TaxID=364733 RepID=A0A8H7A8M2_9EURO|nr:hypothetical protein GJ744_002627 [Endocarpon pusillum]